MCLANVYLLKSNQEKELVCKNVASMSSKDDKLVFTNLLGVPTVVDADLENVNLMDNVIYIRERETL